MTKNNVSDMLSRIEMRIAEMGLTKEQFYQLSGISSASFSQWNTGAHKPTKKKIGQAAAVLGVTFDYLWSGAEKEKAALADEDGLTAAQAAIVDMLVQLAPEDELRAAAYIQALLDARAEPPAGRE